MNVFNLDTWENYKHSGVMYLYEIYDSIKEGEYKNEIEKIRLLLKKEMKQEADELKRKLPAFTVSGIFNTNRREEYLIKYYGLMTLDIDNLKDEEEVKRIKEKICKIKYTKMAFISPSGLGIKIIVETNNTNVEKHKEVYKELLNYYKQELDIEFDEKTIDVARLCFISYDEEAYLNLDSEIFISKNTNIGKEKVDDEFDRIIEKIIEFTKKRQEFKNGNRNRFVYLLVKNSKGAGITKERILEFCLNNCIEEDFTEEEIQNIVKSVYNDDKVCFGQWKYKYKKNL
ncbi:BT4734/BF3469 family protein [Bergeyella zoohelcum]|uniref:BT4734-like N-terminal domain-containing protein n=1 Tax=Bergeyella zoohelcum ATCC 43767 TaxID=883096 RepID=K1MN05_9FLAO|nr:BT4734/BF3469 family protein [Bergeyella zoohelcum]EKB57524.1 hypothetical protein HMPREF9699_01010 [Bergeyella zoohelcum ATCC 43767]SUV48806.1 VirE N-terminal domain [Bergeyella zoohelcum]